MSEIYKKYTWISSSIIYSILLFAFVGLPCVVIAQTSYTDSLRNLLRTLPDDTVKVIVYEQLAGNPNSEPDSCIHYSTEGLKLANKLNLPLKQIKLHKLKSVALGERGNYLLSLKHAFKALEIANQIEDKSEITDCKAFIAVAYFYAKDYENAISYAREVQRSYKSLGRNNILITGFLGEAYYEKGELDSALFYTKLSYDLERRSHFSWSIPYLYMGKFAERKGHFNEALSYYRSSILRENSQADIIKGYLAIGEVFRKINNPDSSIYYAKQAYRITKTTSLYSYSYQASELLKSLYKQINQIDSAFKYQELMVVEKDSLFNRDKLNQIQSFAYEDEKRKEILKAEIERANNQIKLFSLSAGLIVILIIVFLLIRNNRFKQKAYNLLENQKSDIDRQKSKAEQTLLELRTTQSQLIQSEKMASLGELTAGIAHEIQNPLNFVNNFSEVSTELVAEMNAEIDKGNNQEAKEIANDLKQNLEKINQHGKRAADIVKGMLQHSRSSSGVKEPTDINALADEYLRLAYHGLRAKDKSFNATMKTEYDKTIVNINVVPQDIGRVILNLITNAFYVVNEKKNQRLDNYEPTISVITKKIGDKVLISVKDNGNGIPKKVLDKIFQPFFTTKPTGQGTGLGLSLSYDIVKAHGGELEVETLSAEAAAQEGKEGEGSEFIIVLPVV